MAALRQTLMARLNASFDRELEQSGQRALEAMGPYSRFVRSEGERFRGQRDELATLRGSLEALKARIESL